MSSACDQFSPHVNSHQHGPNYRWWIPEDGIRRDVIQADIQRYLGPDALVKPGDGTGQDKVSLRTAVMLGHSI